MSRPRVLVAGAGEAGLDELLAALARRGIETLLVSRLVSDVIEQRPNLVLLVGDATEDGGERHVRALRSVADTFVITLVDAEPLGRRLLPFEKGSDGIVVRSSSADDMAGEVQHLLAETARRASERPGSWPHAMVGFGSADLRRTATPEEGSTRELEIPSEEIIDWDDHENVTTQQPVEEAARWRRIAARDRGELPTPEARAALDLDGKPVLVAPDGDDDADLRETREHAQIAGREPPSLEVTRPLPALPASALEVTRPVPAIIAPVEDDTPAPLVLQAPAPSLDELLRDAAERVEPLEPRPIVQPAVAPGAPVSSPLLEPPRLSSVPPAPALRVRRDPGPRASLVPAALVLSAMMLLVAVMVAPTVIEWARGASSADAESSEPRAAARPSSEPRVAHASERAPVVAQEARPVAAEGASSTEVTPVIAPEAPPPPPPPQLAASAPPVASDLAEHTPDELVARGQVLARRGEHEAAREAFLAAAELDPADPHAPAGLARLALATDQPEDAVHWAERAVALRRRRAVYHVLLGDACERAGDHQRAVAEWQLALELEPDHTEAQQRLAQ